MTWKCKKEHNFVTKKGCFGCFAARELNRSTITKAELNLVEWVEK
jgi:hypothetical protein